tara:strand:- start:397 stop:642 length:246 start_codon:yes stop_codon:yes gene_type:complete
MNITDYIVWITLSATGILLVFIGASLGMNDHTALNHEMGAFIGTIGSLIILGGLLFAFITEHVDYKRRMRIAHKKGANWPK